MILKNRGIALFFFKKKLGPVALLAATRYLWRNRSRVAQPNQVAVFAIKNELVFNILIMNTFIIDGNINFLINVFPIRQ